MESHYNQTGSWLLSSLLPSSTSLLVQLCCNSPTSTMFVFSLGEVKYQIFFQVLLNIFFQVLCPRFPCWLSAGLVEAATSPGEMLGASGGWSSVLCSLHISHRGWAGPATRAQPPPSTSPAQPSPAHQIKAATIFRGIFHSHCNQRRYGECKNLFRQYYLPSI